jgi:galactonate dehydratase
VKIASLETFLANAGLRNYLFIRLRTDTGLCGWGEASLEWQELTVRTLVHEWVEERVLSRDPFDIEAVVGGMIRDQYQGGATVLTAISGVELALWDLVGKACGQPVYKLMGGKCRERLMAYANGWYGGARTPEEYAARAREAVARGYRALKFDPFGIAWKHLSRAQMAEAEALVEAVRRAAGEEVELMVEVHGRLAVEDAVEMGLRLEQYRPCWYEEPVTPWSIELLRQVSAALPFPVAAGERLYTLEEFHHLTATRAAHVVQMDPAHCGGLLVSKKIAAMAQAQDLRIAPHCSIGPVALAAALHLGFSAPNAFVQENFADYDVPWRPALASGWNPCEAGFFALPDKPGLGVEIDPEVCQAHPYRRNSFPSLWDDRWLRDFTQNQKQ